MANKKLVMGMSTVALAAIMAAGVNGSAYAADGDLHKGTINLGTIGHVLLTNKAEIFKMIPALDTYGYEVQGKIYDAAQVDAEFKLNPTGTVAAVQATIKAKLVAESDVNVALAVQSVSAINGTLTVKLNKDTDVVPAATDFKITQSINGAATTVAATSIVWDRANLTAKLTIPQVVATQTVQTATYAVAYKDTVAVSGSTTIAAVPLDLKVASVSIQNGKELTVVFNQEVDQATAENKANYSFDLNQSNLFDGAETLDNAAFTNETVKLQSDSKTVKIYLGDANVTNVDTFTTNNSVYKVKVASVKSKDLSKTLETFENGVNFNDTVAPTLASLTQPQTGILKVVFSEPLKTKPVVRIDGVELIAAAVTPNVVAKNTNTYDINYSALTLSAGQHTVSFTSAKDMNNTNIISPNPTESTFVVGGDVTAPSVTSVLVTAENEVKIVFSEPLNAAPAVEIVDGNLVGTNSVVLAVLDTKDSTGKTYIATYTAVVPNGAGAPTTPDAELVYGTNKFLNRTVKIQKSQLVDKFANTATQDYTTPVQFVKDEVKPTVLRGFVDGTKLVLQFSEDVKPGGGAATTAVAFTNTDGVRFTTTGTIAEFNGYDYDKDGTKDADYATIDLSGVANIASITNILPGTLAVTFTGNEVTDSAFALNAIAANTTVTVGNTGTGSTAIPVVSVTGAATDVTGFTLAFTQDMSDTAKNAANYTLGGKTLTELGADVYFSTDKKTVRVDLPKNSIPTTGDRTLIVSTNVKDTAGNSLASTNREIVVAGVIDNTLATLTKVEAKDSTVLTLTLSELVYSTGAADSQADFKVYINDVETAVTKIIPGGTGSGVATSSNTATITLASPIAADAKVRVEVKSNASIIKDNAGNTLSVGSTISK